MEGTLPPNTDQFSMEFAGECPRDLLARWVVHSAALYRHGMPKAFFYRFYGAYAVYRALYLLAAPPAPE